MKMATNTIDKSNKWKLFQNISDNIALDGGNADGYNSYGDGFRYFLKNLDYDKFLIFSKYSNLFDAADDLSIKFSESLYLIKENNEAKRILDKAFSKIKDRNLIITENYHRLIRIINLYYSLDLIKDTSSVIEYCIEQSMYFHGAYYDNLLDEINDESKNLSQAEEEERKFEEKHSILPLLTFIYIYSKIINKEKAVGFINKISSKKLSLIGKEYFINALIKNNEITFYDYLEDYYKLDKDFEDEYLYEHKFEPGLAYSSLLLPPKEITESIFYRDPHRWYYDEKYYLLGSLPIVKIFFVENFPYKIANPKIILSESTKHNLDFSNAYREEWHIDQGVHLAFDIKDKINLNKLKSWEENLWEIGYHEFRTGSYMKEIALKYIHDGHYLEATNIVGGQFTDNDNRGVDIDNAACYEYLMYNLNEYLKDLKVSDYYKIFKKDLKTVK